MTEIRTAKDRQAGALMVLLIGAQAAQIEPLVSHLSSALPDEDLLIAMPEGSAAEARSGLRFVDLPASKASWMLTAADFAHAHQLAQKNEARSILMLGPEASSLEPEGLARLAGATSNGTADLLLPCYTLPSRAGLVNSAILYPLSRALFANRTRFPLAVDLGVSLRMADRLGAAAQRLVALNQSDVPLWAVSEAMVAGMKIEEVDAGPRTLPQPAEPDLNTILPFVTGSLFSDIEAKAAFWQRARVSPALQRQSGIANSAADGSTEVAPMLEGFRLAYTNLREIWGLVLPPNAMLGLKHLSTIDGAAFRMPEALWARSVFDFLIAYRMRTMNRGHLLGALIPLYLAWVASHINTIAAGEDPERHIEQHAAAFETEKAYLVARWRWPDRFNP